jgi:hypothetical protein
LIATPTPLLRTCNHAGPNGVEHYIPDQLQEIRLAVNYNGLVPPLEDVPHTSMMSIEALCVDPVQLAHARGKIAIQGLNNQVIVVGHQAVGITYPVHPPADFIEDREGRLSVLIVQVNSCTAIAT